MQKEFYIGQKVKTSQIGIEKGNSEIIGIISSDRRNEEFFNGYYDVVEFPSGNSYGIFHPEEIEPIEDSIPHIVFDNIASILQ